jgi:hypothetical protein
MKVILFLRDEITNKFIADVNSDMFICRYFGRLTKFLTDFGISYEIYSRNTVVDPDDIGLVLQQDIHAILASRIIPNFTPSAVVNKFVHKDEFSAFLASRGFPQLETRVITSVSQIPDDQGQFVLKPILGQNGSDSTGKIPDALLRWYPDKPTLLANHTAAEIDAVISGGIVIQRGISTNGFTKFVAKHGVVNSRGEVFFLRTKESLNPVANMTRPVGQTQVNRDYGIYTQLEQPIRNLVANAGIINTPINFQFLKDGTTFYPIDFNLRLSPYVFMWAEKYNPVENDRAFAHLFDVDLGLPNTFDSKTITDRSTDWATYLRFQ